MSVTVVRFTAIFFDRSAMQPLQIVIGLGVRAGLQADERSEVLGVLEGEMQDDATADRAAHDDGSIQRKRLAHPEYHVDVVLRGESILEGLPARGRGRFAVPGHVEGNDAILFGNARVVHHGAVLAAVGSRRVQAQQRNAFAGFLHVEPLGAAEKVESQVATDHGFESHLARGAHDAAPSRSRSSRSLKYRRCVMNG